MAYKATITIDELEQMDTQGAAEGAYFELLFDLFYRGLKLEITEESGQTTVIELPPEIDNDESMLRHMALIQLGSRFMTEDQKTELEAWEKENLDGHSVSTSDWPGWERIIGQKKPRKFRSNLVDKSRIPTNGGA